jgi:hypothetical protein
VILLKRSIVLDRKFGSFVFCATWHAFAYLASQTWNECWGLWNY